MPVRSFEGREPSIGPGTWVHPSADVLGDVTIGRDCWIGPGARLRGDYGSIRVGDRTAIEDNCVVHARPGEATVIGARVTVGHAAIVHNATIRDWAIVGMGAVVSDWSVIGEWAVVAEGAVVRQGMEVPPRAIAAGVPARILERGVSDEFVREWTVYKDVYPDLARRYPEGLGPPRE